MATPRSSRGHLIVAVLVGVAVLVHGGLAVVPGERPGWFAVVSSVLALAAAALLVAGLWVPRFGFAAEGEDAWLVACAALGALGVATGLGLAFAVFSAGGRAGGVDLFSLAALLVDAVVVRLAVFTLRRVPAGRGPDRRG